MRWNIFAVLLAVLMLSACGSNSGTIKIGLVGPLTGENAVLGVPIQKGALLAIDEINAAGGINGKQLQLISEDGGCKGEVAAKAGNKLITVDKVQAIVGGVCSSETLAMAPMAEQNTVVLFSTASTNPSISDAGDYIFRSISSDKFQAAVIAEHLIAVGIKNTAVIYANSDYNLGLKNAFQARYEEIGGTVVAAETYEQDSKDFRTQLTKIKSSDPKALYVIPYAEGGLILKQASELGLNIPYFGPESMGDKKIIEQAGSAGEGFVYTVPQFDAENQKSKEFINGFKTKYGEEPGFPAYSGNAYDEIYLFAAAIKQNGETGEGIKNYLYTVKDYDGAGGLLTLDENGDAIKEFELMIVKNGELVKYTTAAAPAPPKEEPKPVEQPKPAPIPPSTVETREAPEAPKPADGQKVTLSLVEWEMRPGETSVKPGKVTMQIINRATRAYTITVQDKGKNILAQSKPIESGTAGTFEFTISSPGAYSLMTEDALRNLKGLLIVE